ncbi:MAG TPA: alpha/beta hydrolase family protein [Solirubrobacterales bacterium]|nr:alpha/beta hydrolase family protein [Solirubrobacterales bacterium]
MKQAIRRLAAVALVSLIPVSSAGASDAQLIDEQQVTDRLLELTISTPAFAEPTKVHVFLPRGYERSGSRQWPVTYFTAGTMNNHDSFANVVNGQKLTRDYPSIVVSPDSNSGYWSDWFNAGAFGPPMYETFVIDQLIPLIDERFRTISRRSHRLVFGISMGGYGSMMFAARHPDLFSAAASLSGAVDSNLPANGAILSLSSTFDGAEPDAIYGPRLTEEVRWRGHNPTDLAANLRGLALQVRTANGVLNPEIGEGDSPDDAASCVVEGGVHMASINLHSELASLGVDHTWLDYGPGCHTPQNFTREIIDTLAAFEAVLADPPARPRKFRYRSIEPRFDVWGWRVRSDPERALEFLEMERASRRGLTLTGSGVTRVKTPPYFRGVRVVEVATSEGRSQSVSPSRLGRLRFTVDLGPPHADQQYTAASQAAGEGTDGYFTKKIVSFAPSHR